MPPKNNLEIIKFLLADVVFRSVKISYCINAPRASRGKAVGIQAKLSFPAMPLEVNVWTGEAVLLGLVVSVVEIVGVIALVTEVVNNGTEELD